MFCLYDLLYYYYVRLFGFTLLCFDVRDVKMRNVLEAEEEESDTENTFELIQSPRLDQIISEYRRVQESAGNEIERKRKAVRSKCDERLWMAALWRDYQLEIVKKSFDSETKQIEREYQVSTGIVITIKF